MIQEMLREGGIGMLFTLIWGFFGLVYAARCVARPTAARLGFVRGIAATTVGAGFAATIAGLVAMSHAAGTCYELGSGCHDGPWRIVVEGSGEAIRNLLVGVIFFTLISFLASFGRLRLKA